MQHQTFSYNIVLFCNLFWLKLIEGILYGSLLQYKTYILLESDDFVLDSK